MNYILDPLSDLPYHAITLILSLPICMWRIKAVMWIWDGMFVGEGKNSQPNPCLLSWTMVIGSPTFCEFSAECLVSQHQGLGDSEVHVKVKGKLDVIYSASHLPHCTIIRNWLLLLLALTLPRNILVMGIDLEGIRIQNSEIRRQSEFRSWLCYLSS